VVGDRLEIPMEGGSLLPLWLSTRVVEDAFDHVAVIELYIVQYNLI
jgi:hypothetical protein